jgi:hypothetical protein
MASVFWLFMTACSDDVPRSDQADAALPDAADPDATPPGADAGAVEHDAGEGGADAAPQPDAAPTGMTVQSVHTSDGYTQVRQGSTVDIVITGANLEGVTSVQVGELEAGSVEALPEAVRARLPVPGGTTPALRDLTAGGRDGTATLVDAIEVTPYVISPTASPDGHGTHQSPMPLCDSAVGDSSAGDTILLLAGEHDCDEFVRLRGGQIVQGQGAATTVVGSRFSRFRGFEVVSSDFRSITTFRDLAIDAAYDAIIASNQGEIVVERVEMTRSGIRAGCAIRCPSRITVTESRFIDTLIGIETEGSPSAVLDVSDSHFSNHGAGIRIRAGRLRVRNTIFERGWTGVQLVGVGPGAVDAEISGGVFTDNGTGVAVRAGTLTMRDTRIVDDESTPLASLQGIYIENGEVTATRVTISGQEQSGVEAFVFSSAVGVVSLTDVLIEGGQYGVRFHGVPRGGRLFMRTTTVRDQTVAAVSNAFRGSSSNSNDLNGSNQLSVVSGVALEDGRTEPRVGSPIRAVGITLNGRSYSGTVEGPAEVLPDYRIVADNGAIRFEDPVP